MARVLTVNVAAAAANPHKAGGLSTGIDKRPQVDRVQVRDPGPKRGGLGSGIVGDVIGDGRHHGGSDQAVYAFAREDLDTWEQRLDRSLPNGFFGENLTTVGIDVNDARIGERWRVGDGVELVVTCPRIPCSTFRGWVGERGWVKLFTAEARPGAYLAVASPGSLAAQEEIEVVHRPDHDVTIALVFRALTLERELLPRLLAAGDDLPADIAQAATEAVSSPDHRQ